jgi:hypothetical protein
MMHKPAKPTRTPKTIIHRAVREDMMIFPKGTLVLSLAVERLAAPDY